MSRVFLLAADKPLPLCDCRTERNKTFGEYTVTTFSGFHVAPHEYYREAVAALKLSMKAYQYALDMENCEEDLAAFRRYLQTHFSAGEEVELWSLWLGDGCGKTAYFRGAFADFDGETLAQLLNPALTCGVDCCRMNITM